MITNEIGKLFKGSLIYGIGNIFNKFITFLLVPLFTSFLKPEDYGIIALLGMVTYLLSGFFTLGTGNSVGICYFSTNDNQERKDIIWTNAVLLLIISVFFVSISILFSSELSQLLFSKQHLGYLIILSLISLSFSNLSSNFNAYFRMNEKAKLFVAISFSTALITSGLDIIFVVVLKLGVKGLIEANVLGQFVSFLIWTIATYKNIKPSLKFSWIPRLVRIGFPSIFGVLAFFIIDFSDRALVERMLGLSELGIYSLGYLFGMGITLLVDGAFGFAWPPFFLKFINRQDEAVFLFGKIFKYYTFLLGLIVLLIFIFAQPIILLMTNSNFYNAWSVIGIISLSYVLKGNYLILLAPVYFEKKIWKTTLIEWSAAILNLAGNFLLIPLLGIQGAALATMLSYFSLSMGCYFVSNHVLKVHFEWGKILMFVIPFIFISLLTFINHELILKTVILTAMYLLFLAYVYKYLLNQQERDLKKIVRFIINGKEEI